MHYQANQGKFQLTMPKDRCFLLPTDTTVELIAQFIAQHIKSLSPLSAIKVKAFEGVNKGAMAVVP